MAPQQRVAASLGRAGDSLTDRLEDLGPSQVGNQQPEEQPACGGSNAPHIRSRAGHAFDQAALAQFPQSAADGDARSPELLHQRRLAGELLPRGVFAGENLSREDLQHLLVLRHVRLGAEFPFGHADITAFYFNIATLRQAQPSKKVNAKERPFMTAFGEIRTREHLFVSDFDQTLSFNDSGVVLSELIGVDGFAERIRGLADIHLVQQGGELAYLLLHDPQYRCVRREHLREVGRRIRLKRNIPLLLNLLEDLDGHHFSFYVVSAAPQEVIEAALDGIVPAEHIIGTQFRYDGATGEIQSLARVPAGYGKVVVVDELRSRLPISHNRVTYVGDGSSDVHVMMHVNRLGGLTIAVSENKYITQIARRTVLADDALSVLVPVLESITSWTPARIREFFEERGFALREWDKVQTDTLTICPVESPLAASTAGVS